MFKRSPKSRFRPDLQSAARAGGRRKSFYLASVALPLVAVLAGVAFFEFRAERQDDGSPSEPSRQIAMLSPDESLAEAVTLSDAEPETQAATAVGPAAPSMTAKADRPAAAAPVSEPAGPAPLSAADPRWGFDAADTASETDRPVPEEDAAARQLAAALQEQGSAMSVEIDDSTTAAVSPDSLAPVEVAETTDEVAMLEASVAASEATRPEAAFVVPEPGDADTDVTPTDESAPGDAVGEPADNLRPATTSGYVNFRAGPSNSAATIEILAAGVEIEAADDCPHFCRARHDGRDGYIYRSYIAFPGEEPRRQATRQAVEPEAAAEPAETAQAQPQSTTDAAGEQAPAQVEQPTEDRRNITFFDLIARD